MNLVVPVILFTVSFMIPHRVAVGRVVIQHVEDGSPAQHAGVLGGDQIISIDGQKIQNVGEPSRTTSGFRQGSYRDLEAAAVTGSR